jgi:large subunit ribosomal protein L10
MRRRSKPGSEERIVNREQKAETIAELQQLLGTHPHLVVATFRGLSVNQETELRGRLRAAGGRYRVLKNRLTKRAAAGTPAEGLAAQLSGPSALAAHPSDAVALAKVLSVFAKENAQLELVGGLVDGRDLLDAAGVKSLALLPGLNELRAQLLALIQTPAAMLARLIATPGTQVARAIDARRERLGGDGA